MAVSKNARTAPRIDGLGAAAHALGARRQRVTALPGAPARTRKEVPAVPLHMAKIAEKVGRTAGHRKKPAAGQ